VNYWLDLRDVGAPTGERLDDALDEAARSVVPSSAGWSSVTPEGEGWEVRRAVEPSMESSATLLRAVQTAAERHRRAAQPDGYGDGSDPP
jgi:hypothetical protein